MPPVSDASHDLALQAAQATELYRQGLWVPAEATCRAIISRQATQFDALNTLALITAQTDRMQEAAALFGSAAAARPHLAAAHLNHGNALRALGELEPAITCFDRALSADQNFAQASFSRAETLEEMGQFELARQAYERTIASAPDFVDAYNNLGNVLQVLGRHPQALEAYQRAIAIRPQFPEALYNCANLLLWMKRPQEALAHFDAALRVAPDYAEALNNRGNVLQELRRLDEALASYDRALQLRPEFAEAHFNRAVTLAQLARRAHALASFDRAIALRPGYAEAYVERGEILMQLKQFEQASASFETAWRLDPERPWIYGALLHAKAQLCDWTEFGEHAERLAARVAAGLRAAPPFAVLEFTDDPSLQRAAARSWAAELPMATAPRRAPVRRERIRLGYFSSDFQLHPTSHLAAGLFEHHDRSRFHLTAFSIGPASQDSMRQRLLPVFDDFVEAGQLTAEEIVRHCVERGVDIAIDLNGYTRHARAAIFALRAAPIQVNYLGYPGTMGAAFMDYVIADATVIPDDARRHFDECVVYLPHSYQPNDRARPVVESGRARAEEGLPSDGFVYVCFNNAAKFTPAVFDSWMRILSRVEGSVLWLLEDSSAAVNNLRREAEARGVAGERLVFARRAPNAQHLARQVVADLFLDTLPYNAHTTASDALWAGVPVLTLPGRSFASRVGASLVRAAGLPELVTSSVSAYEDLAVELAREPERLRALTERLRLGRFTVPLFDTAAYTKHLEAAYDRMQNRLLAGLPPDVIRIAP